MTENKKTNPNKDNRPVFLEKKDQMWRRLKIQRNDNNVEKIRQTCCKIFFFKIWSDLSIHIFQFLIFLFWAPFIKVIIFYMISRGLYACTSTLLLSTSIFVLYLRVASSIGCYSSSTTVGLGKSLYVILAQNWLATNSCSIDWRT